MNVKGTIDWVEDYNLRQYIIDQFVRTMRLHGFDIIEPSILEKYDLFKRTVGESSDIMQKEMFFVVSEAKQDLNIVLRPEFTTSVIRSLIESGNIYDKRVAYHGKVFRHNRPQKGRYREFTQLGCEVFDDNPYTDVDVISSAVKFLDSLNIKPRIRINSLGDFDAIAKYNQILAEYLEEKKILNEYLDKNKINSLQNPIRILDKMSDEDKKYYKIPKISDYMSTQDLKRFDTVCDGLEKLNIEFIVDDYLVRGLDYYNNTIFEIEDQKLGMSILGGGAYSGLVKRIGGPDIPGIGWSFGLERILLMNLGVEMNEQKKVAVISIDEPDYAIQVANLIRQKYNSTILFGNFKKSMKKLQKLDPSYIVFCGLDEKESNIVKIKNCKNGNQEILNLDKMMSFLGE